MRQSGASTCNVTRAQPGVLGSFKYTAFQLDLPASEHEHISSMPALRDLLLRRQLLLLLVRVYAAQKDVSLTVSTAAVVNIT